MKHTPGPWTAMPTPPPSRVDHGWRAMAICGKWMVGAPAEVAFKQWNNESNARLIAAAPEMLETCKELYEWLANIPPSVFQSLPETTKDKLINAIAKAEGRE